MIVFLLMCILAAILAGPVGVAFVLGGYAVLFVISIFIEASKNKGNRRHA